MKVNWMLFEGSSHCEEGLALFAIGEIKTFKELERYFLPHMKEQATEVKRMKNSRVGIKKMRLRAARAYQRFVGYTPQKNYAY